MALIAWDEVCKSKEEGGLGFKLLKPFHEALWGNNYQNSLINLLHYGLKSLNISTWHHRMFGIYDWVRHHHRPGGRL